MDYGALVEVGTLLGGILLHYKGISKKLDGMVDVQKRHEQRIIKIEKKLQINDSFEGSAI